MYIQENGENEKCKDVGDCDEASKLLDLYMAELGESSLKLFESQQVNVFKKKKCIWW